MENLLENKSSRRIEKLNVSLQLSHKSKTYDLKDKDDLKELLKSTVYSFTEYTEYKVKLNNLLKRFEESIKYFDTATFLNFNTKALDYNQVLIRCCNSLLSTFVNFVELSYKAEKECFDILTTVFDSSKEFQEYILGFSVKDFNEINDKLENFISQEVSELEYESNSEEVFNLFLKKLKEVLL